ncbi:cupin domain-containing protein [Teredinibacter waterburyi]|uniref:cupin domain-containing protein n=1 Tax=Teredinibacter waterburyi TaxID=1500538 RepID=UPI00165EE4FA|nr:cupin domain-containing protein [Teredinibacter waterburyi]
MTQARLTHLGDMPIETFLRDYWQQKPLLIRQAIPQFESPLCGDELAGLALEEDVVSRLVIEKPEQNQWSLTHGPLADDAFATLPSSHWTLLIQHADLLDPEVNALLDLFRFIPNWRLDDIMISYAADQGGVGPHFDYYDVFLLQGEGRRRWRIGQTCDSHSEMLEDQDMKVLKDFDTLHDWIVEPGDLLYIPPNVAHWGTAEGNCITYSIGFRAPSYSDILLDLTEEAASHCNPDQRYTDPNLPLQAHTGELSSNSIEQLKAIIASQLGDEQQLANWFGSYMTRPNPGGQFADENALSEDELNAESIALSRFARCAFYPISTATDDAANKQTTDQCQLFINGEAWECSRALAQKLSAYQAIQYQDVTAEERELLRQLAQLGWLVDADET